MTTPSLGFDTKTKTALILYDDNWLSCIDSEQYQRVIYFDFKAFWIQWSPKPRNGGCESKRRLNLKIIFSPYFQNAIEIK